MRILIALVVIGAVIGGIVTHRRHEEPPVVAPVAIASPERVASSRQPSQHDWAKSALDRAGDVKRQVLEQRKQNDGK